MIRNPQFVVMYIAYIDSKNGHDNSIVTKISDNPNAVGFTGVKIQLFSSESKALDFALEYIPESIIFHMDFLSNDINLTHEQITTFNKLLSEILVVDPFTVKVKLDLLLSKKQEFYKYYLENFPFQYQEVRICEIDRKKD